MLTTILNALSRLFTWWIVVAPWEQALRVRLGKRVDKLEAGVFLRIPFVDRIFKQSIRRRLNILRPQTLTTQDRHVVTSCGAVGYSIGNLEMLYQTMESPNDTIENEVAAIVAQYIGTHDLADCKAVEIEKSVMEKMDLSKYGLTGQEFYMTSFATSKTYRFITGDMQQWQRDSQMSMAETVHQPGPPQR
jgi:hypothetical protein